MKQRKRIYYSAAQRAAIWDRWKARESMSSIGQRFDRESSVFSVLSPTGGIRPPDRRRADRALSLGSPGQVRLSQPAICSGVGLLRHYRAGHASAHLDVALRQPCPCAILNQSSRLHLQFCAGGVEVIFGHLTAVELRLKRVSQTAILS